MSLVSASVFHESRRQKQAALPENANCARDPDRGLNNPHAAAELTEDADSMLIDEESVIKYSLNYSYNDHCMKNLLAWRRNKY